MKSLRSLMQSSSPFRSITIGLTAILFLVTATSIFLKNSYDENFKAHQKINFSLQEHALIFVSQLHRIAEDKAITQGSEWNLQNTVSQGLQREIKPGGFNFLEIVDSQCKALTKTQGESNAPGCSPEELNKEKLKTSLMKDGSPALVAVVPFQKNYFLRGVVNFNMNWINESILQPNSLDENDFLVQFDAAKSRWMIQPKSKITAGITKLGSFVRVRSHSQLIFLTGLLLLIVVLYSAKTKALSEILNAEHQSLFKTQNQLRALEQTHQEQKSKLSEVERQLETSHSRILKLEKDNQHMGRFEAFADEISRSYLTLQKKSEEWQEHLDDILQIVQQNANQHVHSASTIMDQWNYGVRQGANSELGARRHFKILVETFDPKTGKNKLESDLTNLTESLEQLKDQMIHISLQLAALKTATASSTSLVTHWSKLINQTEGIEQQPGDLLRAYKGAEQMIRFETQYSNVSLSPPVMVGSLGFKNPVVSEPILTSIFYHLILYVLYQTEQTSGSRLVKTFMKSSGNVNKFIINCSCEGSLILSSHSESSRKQWNIIGHLARLSNLAIDVIPPTQGLYAVALRWTTDHKTNSKTSVDNHSELDHRQSKDH